MKEIFASTYGRFFGTIANYFCTISTSAITIYAIYLGTMILSAVAAHLIYKYESQANAIWLRIALFFVFSLFTAGIVLVTINEIKNM